MKILGDVTDESVLKEATNQCIEKFGKLDILVVSQFQFDYRIKN